MLTIAYENIATIIYHCRLSKIDKVHKKERANKNPILTVVKEFGSLNGNCQVLSSDSLLVSCSTFVIGLLGSSCHHHGMEEGMSD